MNAEILGKTTPKGIKTNIHPIITKKGIAKLCNLNLPL